MELDKETKLYLIILQVYGFGDSPSQIIRRLAWQYIQKFRDQILASPAKTIATQVFEEIEKVKVTKAKLSMQKIISELNHWEAL